jgi:glyoxylase-like metal-dependent hydrolase (beta-lactamase superfamily II)
MTMTLTRRAALTGVAATSAAAAALTTGALAASPMAGAMRPDFYRFKLGSFEVGTILDGSITRGEPYGIFGTDQDPATVAALAEANFLPADMLRNDYTPVVVNTGREVVLFDTGNGPARRPGRGALRQKLADTGIAADQVDIVVLTHFHPDHIGGIMEGDAPAYPNARYIAPRAEFDWWKANSDVRGEDYKALLERTAFAVADRMTFLEDGQDVVTGITMIAAAGHTPGHGVYNVESDGKRLMVCADFCNHFVLSMQRPDWHVRFDMDKDAAAASRKRVLDMIATDRVAFTSYHMPFPAVGFVERLGEGYRYVPVSYQFGV